MEPGVRNFSKRFHPARETRYSGWWPKTVKAREAKYEYRANRKASERGYRDAVDRLLKDPWYVQNLSQRPATTVGAQSRARLLLIAWKIKQAKLRGELPEDYAHEARNPRTLGIIRPRVDPPEEGDL